MKMDNTNGDTCAVKIKRKQGGQPGNQNARIHGFYSKVLDAEEKRDYEEARNIQGLDEEIALLRAKIASIMRHDGQNFKLLMIALATMCKLVATQGHIPTNDPERFRKGFMRAVDGLGIPEKFFKGRIFGKEAAAVSDSNL